MTKIKGSILVGLFLVLIMAALCHEAKAETTIEVGPTFLSHDFAEGGLLLFSERVDKYEFGLGYVSEQFVNTCGRKDCDFDMQENLFVHVQRVIPYKSFEFGIGPAYFQNTNRALGKQFTAALSVSWQVTDHLSIKARHWSNAGSGVPNMGQDALVIGWTF